MADTDLNTLKLRLAEAEVAYHKLLLGGGVVSFKDQNGETVQYAQANASRLAGYIQALKDQIALCSGARPLGPMRTWM